MTVLIVDDQPLNLRLLRAILEAEGYTVCEAADGVDALQVLADKKVDAIISDILMPRMDGYRFCSAVRGNPSFAKTPFIFYTATYNSPADEKLCYDLGADKYLIKPASAETILETLRSVIQTAPARNFSPVHADTPYVMKQYSEQLVLKLEEKNRELAHTIALLSDSEAKFTGAFQWNPAGMTISDFQGGRLIDVNEKFLSIFGFTRDEVIGKTAAELNIISADERAKIARQTKEKGSLPYQTIEARTKTGDLRFIQFSSTVIEIGGAEYMLMTALDITDAKLAGQKLHAREAELEEAQRVGQIGSWEADLATDQSVWSNELFRLLGLKPSQEKQTFSAYLESVHPEDRETLRTAARKAIGEGGTFTLDYRVIRSDGEIRWVHARTEGLPDPEGNMARMRGTIQDITDRKLAEADALESRKKTEQAYAQLKREVAERNKAEEQFRQAQKMEAIGQLSGGIAHDFNNLLTVILGNTSLLEDYQLEAAARGPLEEIKKSAERAANLTRQLLLFARKQTMQMRNLDLNAAIAETVEMLIRIVGEDIQLDFQPASRQLWLNADPGMLDQILLNLAVNARDAMPKGGRLGIGTMYKDLDEKTASTFPNGRPGSFAIISVADSGSGIPASILPRIFDPFFTTKDVDKGTGLGLATVFGIVQQHAGWIGVESNEGAGTTFRIYLPLTEKTATTPAPKTVDTQPDRGSETILLVEDDPSIRKMVSRYLSQLGYDVIVADNGPAALTAMAECSKKVDLMLTDLVMPGGLNGVELAEKLKKENPDLRVIFASGYSDTMHAASVRLIAGVNFLPKPFALADAVKTIRRQLDSSER